MDQSFLPVSQFRRAIGVQPPYDLVEAAGTNVAIARRGAGLPVLCLHAAAHGGRDFESLVDALVPLGFEMVCVDWPGHGASPPDASGQPASAKRYAAVLNDLIPVLFGDARPIVIGNSIGGAAALIAALEKPEAMRALVLCNPGGLAPLDSLAIAVIKLLVRFFEAGPAARIGFQSPMASIIGWFCRESLPKSSARASSRQGRKWHRSLHRLGAALEKPMLISGNERRHSTCPYFLLGLSPIKSSRGHGPSARWKRPRRQRWNSSKAAMPPFWKTRSRFKRRFWHLCVAYLMAR